MMQNTPIQPTGLDEHSSFEDLMADLAAHFVNLPAEHIDTAIENVQRAICIQLNLDRSGLWQCVQDDADALRLSHLYRRIEDPLVAESPELELFPVEPVKTHSPEVGMRIDAKVVFPGMYQQLRAGKTVVINSPDDIPAQAGQDKKQFTAFGGHSTVVVPLSWGSEWLGCVTFAKMTGPRVWTQDAMRCFEMVGNLLANALGRGRADDALCECQKRLSLADDAGGAAWWIFQAGDMEVLASAKARELIQFGCEERLDFDAFIQRIHPEDRDRVKDAVQRAIQSGEELSIEFRVRGPPRCSLIASVVRCWKRMVTKRQSCTWSSGTARRI